MESALPRSLSNIYKEDKFMQRAVCKYQEMSISPILKVMEENNKIFLEGRKLLVEWVPG